MPALSDSSTFEFLILQHWCDAYQMVHIEAGGIEDRTWRGGTITNLKVFLKHFSASPKILIKNTIFAREKKIIFNVPFFSQQFALKFVQ